MRYIVPALLLFAACSDGKRNIRDYYFPVLDLQAGQVYVFESKDGEQTANEYWYYRGMVRDSGIFFTATYYDPSFRVGQITTEKITETGAVTREVYLYEKDTLSDKEIQLPTVLESRSVFPFQVTDSLGIYLYKLHYRPRFDTSATIYLVRNRSFLGDGPDFLFEGKHYPTVAFRLREAIGSQKEGNAEIEGEGVEWYAKGLGLVYFRKAFGDNLVFEGTLKERISMQELEKRAKQ